MEVNWCQVFHYYSGESAVLSKEKAGLMTTAVTGGYGLGFYLQSSGQTARFGHGGSNEGFKCQMTAFREQGRGGAFTVYSSKFAAEKISGTQFNFAWHLMFGIEVILKNISAILEFQVLKVSVADIDPDLTQYFWMLGIRF